MIKDNERSGPVLPLPNGRGGQLSVKRAGRTISAIGEKANVVTKTKPKIEYASAHDLRRSFGTRWAKKVKPLVLQRMMRHASVETTIKYYADVDAEWISDEIWSGHTTGHTGNLTEDRDPGKVKKPGK